MAQRPAESKPKAELIGIKKIFRKIVKLKLFAILIFVLPSCDLRKQREAMVSANILSIDTAKQVKNILSESEECPTMMDGWELVDSNIGFEYRSYSGAGNTQYPVILRCFRTLNFDIMVSYSFDAETIITGGVSKDTSISYGHFTDRKVMPISQQTDTVALARQVVYEQ